MANVTVNVGELYDREKRMKEIGEKLIKYMDQIVNEATNVKTGWTGFNSDSYVDSFLEFKPKILQKCSAILATALGIGQTADIISKLQLDTNARVKSLGIGSSSSLTLSNNSTANTSTPDVSSAEISSTDIDSSSVVKVINDGEVIGYTQGETFKAQSYGENYTDEEFMQLAAIVGGEDSGSYEGALAVASTICNRADAGNWGGGHDPLEVAKAPSQFVAYNGELYNKYISNPSSMPDYVVQATRDALSGTRNTTADSFRSFEKSGEVCTQIGTDGNYYFKA